ncbi:MAG: phosphohydrolase [Pseudomonadota bacterium]
MTMPWIQTEKGRRFDLVATSPAQVDVEEIASALAKICRFNGHSRYFYSVAQHSVIVADMLPPDARVYGLFHDAHEAYVGDLATPVKDALRQETGGIDAWRAMVDRIDAAIFGALGLQWPMPADIARQVKHADLVALATERRDLMADGPVWSQRMPQPLPRRIVPWGWDKAMETFLDRVRRLPLPQAPHGALAS